MGCSGSKAAPPPSDALKKLHSDKSSRTAPNTSDVGAGAGTEESPGGSKSVAALKIQRLARHSSQRKVALEESAWKIFNELDALDEAETLLMSNFITDILEAEEFRYLRDTDCAQRASQRLDIGSITITIAEDKSSPAALGSAADFDLPGKTPHAEVAERVAQVYRRGGKLSEHLMHRILRTVFQKLKKLPNVTYIECQSNEKMTVVGDLHGELSDLLYILDNSGWPSATNKYLFNGDLVDRGANSVEVVTLVFALYAAYPKDVFVNRGNHEDKGVCSYYGFIDECKEKYDLTLFEMFCESFKLLPLCSVINKAVFVVHGGLFHSHDVTLADIDRVDRLDYKAEKINAHSERNKKDPDGFYLRSIQQCALWSDPGMNDQVVSNNSRGAGVLFGPSVTQCFLQKNNLKLVVRSHECVADGFEWAFQGTSMSRSLCTVFSASNYGSSGNSAAFLVLFGHAVEGAAHHIEGTDMCLEAHTFSTDNSRPVSLLREGSEHILNDLVVKRWNALRLNFSAADVGNTGFVSSVKWAEIMREVTKLEILFLPLLPVLAPPGAIEGPNIKYNVFLEKYAAGKTGDHVEMNALYEHKKELEAIFRFFDTDGDGTISAEEFRTGFDNINKKQPPEKQLKNPDEILRIMDFDSNQSIDMNEFFEAFRLLHKPRDHKASEADS